MSGEGFYRGLRSPLSLVKVSVEDGGLHSNEGFYRGYRSPLSLVKVSIENGGLNYLW